MLQPEQQAPDPPSSPAGRDLSWSTVERIAKDFFIPLFAVILGSWIAGAQARAQRREARISSALEVYQEFFQRRNDAVKALLDGEAGLVSGKTEGKLEAVRGSLWKVFGAESANIRTNLAFSIVQTLDEMQSDIANGRLDLFEKHREQERISYHELGVGVQDLLDRLPRVPKAKNLESRLKEIIAKQNAIMTIKPKA